MFNNTTLLALYKEEKADMEFPSSPFIPFKQWKAEYLVDWEANHKVTAEDEAQEEADRLVSEADAELRKKAPTIKPKKKAKKKPVAIVKTKIKKHSKKQDAIKVYQSMMVDGVHPERKLVIQAFMTQVDMSQAGASTYHHNIKKELS